MASFSYWSPHTPSEVFERLRAEGALASEADLLPEVRACAAGVDVEQQGNRFRVRLRRRGRRSWSGPLAVGEVRTAARGTELTGVIRASRADVCSGVVWSSWLAYLGSREGDVLWAVIPFLFGAAFVAISLLGSHEPREHALRAVLAAAADGQEDDVPTSDVHDG